MAYRRKIYSVSDIKPPKIESETILNNDEFFYFLDELRKFERDYERNIRGDSKIKKSKNFSFVEPRLNVPSFSSFSYETKIKRSPAVRSRPAYQLRERLKTEEFPFYHRYDKEISKKNTANVIRFLDGEDEKDFDRRYEKQIKEELKYQKLKIPKKIKPKKVKIRKDKKRKKISYPSISVSDFKKISISFAGVGLVIIIILGALSIYGKSFGLKGKVMGESQEGYTNLTSAVDNIKNQDFQSSSLNFDNAYQSFSEASADLDSIGGALINLSKFVPFASKLSSGKNMVEAGKHISLAGKAINDLIADTYSIKNPLDENNSENISLLSLFQSMEKNLKVIQSELGETQKNLDNVAIDDLPKDKQSEFALLKSELPQINKTIASFLDNSHIFSDLLGGNGPRKYLFLFQNNQEMRPTGGFIGSYGLLDINDGKIRKFFIDGIFNPDGQLKEKIVPPKPIQKISAAWSLHDSNWFPDFPTSARKAILFYEKTGGPTADGVITLTPDIMEKLLEITGPIEMPEYDVTINAQNFIEKTQYEVEIDYDKEENQPKKIIADLAPIVIDKISNSRDFGTISKVLGVLSDGLKEKQILLYSQNEELQEMISEEGWSGEMQNTGKDYVSVINTNINGYKTDGVIDEKIEHSAEIQDDGSVIDTLTITRKHNGGNEQYEWWNKVNADYLRVYVPQGSKLLDVSGQTLEFNDPPLDYDALGFKRDPDVQSEEKNMLLNEETGVRTYDQFGKTVFANWAYVSPQETVVVKYKYLLPFKLSLDNSESPLDSYSLLAQKQSGSEGSKFISKVKYPSDYELRWKYPDELAENNNSLKLDTDLKTDKFTGMVFLSKSN